MAFLLPLLALRAWMFWVRRGRSLPSTSQCGTGVGEVVEPGSSLQVGAPGTEWAVPELSGGQHSGCRVAAQAQESSDTVGEQEDTGRVACGGGWDPVWAGIPG